MTEAQFNRITLLENELRESRSDYDAVIASLPTDPRARLGALATVLELDALQAMNDDLPLEELIRDRDQRRREARQVEERLRDQGIEFPGQGQER